MKFICSLLVVEDIERSKAFYTNILGQRIKLDFGDNVTFVGDFAIHKQSHYRILIDNREIILGKNNIELYFEYNNVEEKEREFESQGVQFVHRTKEQPWRQKVVRIYDPDGYIIEIGESLAHLCFRLYNEGMTETEISQLIGLDTQMVRNGIQEFKE